jgi:tRNA1Val (adenine37-N6)-methyltransferase
MNDKFEFRDFSMLQSAVGQRVNTDSCVFAELIGSGDLEPKQILDIGTGTGVVALMLAHRFKDAKITAVEPINSVADVAQKNFSQDIWINRIDLLRTRIQDAIFSNNEQFDLVLCNPPYFQNSTLSSDHATEVARHNSDLSPKKIFDEMYRYMTPNGSAWISFPEESSELWLSEGKAHELHLTHHFILSEHPEAKPHMAVVGWSRTKPASVVTFVHYYRVAQQGALSPWMKSFRKKWFPAKYNKNMYAV